jgi:hypothetical protein
MPLSIPSGRKGERQYGLSTLGRRIVLLLLKGPPSAVRVVEALAILSEITSDLVLCADIPEEAMLIDVKRPIYTPFPVNWNSMTESWKIILSIPWLPG